MSGETEFLLFAGDSFYPSGGWKDFVSIHSTLQEATEAAANKSCDWWHVVRKEPGGVAIVAEGKRT